MYQSIRKVKNVEVLRHPSGMKHDRRMTPSGAQLYRVVADVSSQPVEEEGARFTIFSRPYHQQLQYISMLLVLVHTYARHSS